MTALVLDCSVAMSWCFEDEQSDATDAILRRVAKKGAFVPALWCWEIANVLLVAERHSRLTRADAETFSRLLRALPIEIDSSLTTLNRAYALGRDYGLSSYDAVYLDTALRLEVPLATTDQELRAAAQGAGVELA